MMSPKNIAAVIPPLVAVSPPVNAPKSPFLSIPSITPFPKAYQKPVNGIVAPHPAKSTSG